MGKNKLKKFSELEKMQCVHQYPRERVLAEGFPHKGKWRENVFHNNNEITLELGCGKGEYTVELARANNERNYIGIDIKGARIWTGAKQVTENNIANASFLRTEIENLEHFFDRDEISEIWITFPDPQMQKVRKRLTSSRFLSLYSSFLKNDGIINLKTDSPFLFEYTKRLLELNMLKILRISDDLYGSGEADLNSSIKTFYETQWLQRGKKIKLISFSLENKNSFEEPDTDDIEKDDYRAYPRHSVINPYLENK